jgi:TRAP-type C4-dicarboxylate transport system permease small subunit
MTDRPETRDAEPGVSFELVLVNVGFVILLIAICWGVLSRYVIKTPASWVEEVSSIAFAWVTFVGAAEVHRRGRHVSVDLLTALLPAGPRAVLAWAVELFVAGFCCYAAWLGAQQAWVSHVSSTSMLRIPLSVGYGGLTLGFLLMAWRSAQRLLARRGD